MRFHCVRWQSICVTCLASAFVISSAHGQTKSGKKPMSFIKDVAPILRDNCMACHDAKKHKGKFDMSTYESFRKGGTGDDPITPGKPDESPLLDRLKATDKSR